MNGRNTVLWAIIALIVVVAVGFMIAATFFAPADGWWMGDHMSSLTGWGWILMIAMMGLVPVVIIAIIVLLARPSQRPPSPPSYPPQPRTDLEEGRGRKEALNIIGERYGRGEISREEYLRMKEDLE